MSTHHLVVNDLTTDGVGWRAHVYQTDDDGGALSLCGLPWPDMPEPVMGDGMLVPCDECHIGRNLPRVLAEVQTMFVHYAADTGDGNACDQPDQDPPELGVSTVHIPCGSCLSLKGPMEWEVVIPD